MSYQPPPRPIAGPDDFAVWADDRIDRCWVIEFVGSRADCLRYLDLALINETHGFRLWGFAVYPPGTSPLG